MTSNANIRPGRRIAPLWKMGTVRRDADSLIAKKLADGLTSPVWAAGAFTRHIAFGFFQPVSLCGRHVGSTSTEPMPTPIGVACPTCIRVWNRAMDVHNETVDETNESAISEKADEFDTLIGSDDVDAVRTQWTDLFLNNRRLALLVRERLQERDIDIYDVMRVVA